MMLDLKAAFATFPTLETQRLILRAVTPLDSEDLFRLRSDPLAMRYFGSPAITSIAEAIRIEEEFADSFAKHTGIRWAITQRGADHLIGTCGYWRLIKPHFRAEIGYELLPAFWGQGIMPEAVAAMLTWGFDTMGLHSVEAQIDPDNTGSRRVLEKLGFVQEGYFRENYYMNGHFTDTPVFSLLKSDWHKKSIQ